MRKIYVLLIGAVSLFAAPRSHALIITSIEPIIGYERVQKLIPNNHTRERIRYGARVTAGLLLISAEAEYTTTNDTEDFPALSLTVKEKSDKARLGLRSTFRLLGLVYIFARGGCQASQSTTEQINAGVSTVTTEAIKYRPYLGGGLRVRVGRNISLIGDVTTVFESFPNMNNNEYMTTATLAISFP